MYKLTKEQMEDYYTEEFYWDLSGQIIDRAVKTRETALENVETTKMMETIVKAAVKFGMDLELWLNAEETEFWNEFWEILARAKGETDWTLYEPFHKKEKKE